jgi:hydroxypyruvate reductase
MTLEKLRRDAITIFKAGVEAVDPANAVEKYMKREGNVLKVGIRTYDLSDFYGVYVIGTGKAAAAMAQPVEKILGDFLKRGIVNVKYGHGLPLRSIALNEAGHPVPDKAGMRGTKEIIKLLEETGEKDLIIFLISGGGSALLPAPVPGISLNDKQQVTRLLLEAGATIHEMNAVRKHISRVKGGRLTELTHPATLISLILSDVIGDNLDSIASGPTAPDQSTFGDCLSILEKYDTRKKVHGSVMAFLKKGLLGEMKETPKPGDPIFDKTQNEIIGSNIIAVRAAQEKAEELGYNSLILSTSVEGETREVAKVHVAIAKEIRSTGNPMDKPACLISGGETTVTLRGKGQGGRNQEFVLSAAIAMGGMKNIVVLSGGTDGTDGPTDAAGALADSGTVDRAREFGLNPEHFLKENDSYNFFKPLGDLLITGPTYTNVMDLRVIIVI